jgi:two-component system NarL family response regulator
MLRAGVSAYVTKSSAATELVQAIRAAAAGQDYICPEVAGVLTSIVRSDDQKKPQGRVSRRECEVLRLIAEGMRSPAIAERLHISIATVEVHRRNIMRKLSLRTVADLTRYAIREGLVTA